MLLAVPIIVQAAAPAKKKTRPAKTAIAPPAAAAQPPSPAAARKAAPAARPAMVEKPADLSVCYNYGCLAEDSVAFSGKQLAEVHRLLLAAGSSEREREALAQAIGRMYAWAAEQTPIGSDRAGNYADGGIHGQMDCIDHSTTTTRFLRLLEGRGWLRFHRVLEPVHRRTFIFDHYSAALEDLGDGVSVVRTDDEARTWVVDSWYADNGKPPWIVPLKTWESDRAFN
jgi:hypothetical protein